MDEVIQVKDKYYILSSSSLADDRVRILKDGDTFGVFDRSGDIQPLRLREQGIFHRGTRYLSRLELRINGVRPFLLSSSVLDDNTLLAVDMTNPDILSRGRLRLPRGALHIFRAKFLWNGTCFERLRISNYDVRTVEAMLSVVFGSDFVDIFEVRGAYREKRGRMHRPVVDDRAVVLSYAGLDGVRRISRVEWVDGDGGLGGLVVRRKVTSSQMTFRIRLEAKAAGTLFLNYRCQEGKDPGVAVLPFGSAQKRVDADRAQVRAGDCVVTTANEQFNDWLNRSYADIHMMTTRLPEGFYPYAGVPWFNTVFGRDGILSALAFLWINPRLARGVLAHLAALQAQEADVAKDAEPGKILHESRNGELAALGEIPFGLYYGSVDTTPLFVVLAGAYFEHTGDLTFLRNLWPSIERALSWIREHGDLDGDGFVEYSRRSVNGLKNQGWKDSDDSVSHGDGTLARGPIALCEVQGYVYAALTGAACLARALGEENRAAALEGDAGRLRRRFEDAFWSEELSMYVLALDGKKRPCQVRSSNAGHCLFSGIAGDERARRTAEALMSEECFSGWGIRTLGSGEANYNPMSYHNGSIWPHDNGLISWGFSRYGFKDLAVPLLRGLFDASVFLDLHRLPELFCGFPRRPGEGPTLYPVACLPQTWASASAFLFLRSILGLSVHGAEAKILFDHPVLPEFLERITLRNLQAGKSSADIILQRHERDVGVNVVSRRGSVEVVVHK